MKTEKTPEQKTIEQGRAVLELEAQALSRIALRLDESFSRAAELIFKNSGKLIITGIGKSGQIARKLASTFSSTGTPAVFLHPSESAHGDLGLIGSGDIILALSYSGETAELAEVVRFVTRKDIPMIAMTGQSLSSLGKAARVILNCSVEKEACPLGLAPTTSSTAMLGLGDALAMAVLALRGWTADDFADLHPGGQLGAKLTRVKDLMHTGDAVPLVSQDESVKKVLTVMTHREVRGVAGVVDADGNLMGVITDGDVRRRLEKNLSPLDGTAKDLMNPNPRTIDQEELAEKAQFLMEQFKIQVLFVLNNTSGKKPVGVLNYQDLLRVR